MNYAGIDIGTNTILMIIANFDGNRVLTEINDYHGIARLGEGLSQSGRISDNAIKRGLDILSGYKSEIENNKVAKVYACATSAMRDGSNSTEVRQIFEKALGYRINVISGNEEAELTYSGSITENGPASLVDIGGGSTEFISGIDGNIKVRKSLDIGSVRFTEKFFHTSPPSPAEVIIAREEIDRELCCLNKIDFEKDFYAVSGTPVTITRTHRRINGLDEDFKQCILSADELNKVLENYLKLSANEIADKFGIHPLRADVITAGALILQRIFDYFNLDKITVSTKGLRYGALLRAAKK